MKALIIALFTLLTINVSFAKGVASLKVAESFPAKKQHMTLALTVDENIIGPLAYHSFTGLGDNKFADGFTFKTSHQLDVEIKKFIVSPGASLAYVSETKHSDKEIFIKVGYQVW